MFLFRYVTCIDAWDVLIFFTLSLTYSAVNLFVTYSMLKCYLSLCDVSDTAGGLASPKGTAFCWAYIVLCYIFIRC